MQPAIQLIEAIAVLLPAIQVAVPALEAAVSGQTLTPEQEEALVQARLAIEAQAQAGA